MLARFLLNRLRFSSKHDVYTRQSLFKKSLKLSTSYTEDYCLVKLQILKLKTKWNRLPRAKTTAKKVILSSELLRSQNVDCVTRVELFPHSTFSPRCLLLPQFSRGQKTRTLVRKLVPRAFPLEVWRGGKRPWHWPFASCARLSRALLRECLLRRLLMACFQWRYRPYRSRMQAHLCSEQSRRFANSQTPLVNTETGDSRRKFSY